MQFNMSLTLRSYSQLLFKKSREIANYMNKQRE